MTRERKQCPLCSCDLHRVIDRRVSFGYPVVNSVCQRCGFVFQPSQMTEEELAHFYESQYRQLYQGGQDPTQSNLAVQDQRARDLLSFVSPLLKSVKNHLDIGCSTGLLLQRFQEAYHCRAVGIEPGTAFRAYAQKTGLKVYSSLEEIDPPDQSLAAPGELFDLISMIHVLEHISLPVEYLSHIREKYLAADGWLLIEVPNLYAHDSFEIAHLVSFSSHTLVQCLRKAGFNVVKIRTHGSPRSLLFPLYITVLARPLASPVNQVQVANERFVPLKRKVGMFTRRVLTKLLPRLAWLPEKE